MASENETLADIVAEMRDMGNYQSYSGDHAKRLADRIEAAWRRERGAAWNEGYDHAKRDFRPIADELERLLNTPVGNAGALREALEFADRQLMAATESEEYGDDVVYLVGCMRSVARVCRAALSAPPRNCDRFQVAADALQEWQLLVKAKPNTWDFRYNYWLFAPAAERKGVGDENN